jgi:hypothetical protein
MKNYVDGAHDGVLATTVLQLLDQSVVVLCIEQDTSCVHGLLDVVGCYAFTQQYV